jgi:hypothetical protein
LAQLARQWKKAANDLLSELEMTEEQLLQQDLRIEGVFLQTISRYIVLMPPFFVGF